MCSLSVCITANSRCRISAVVCIRVDARVELVANVARVRSDICRAGSRAPMVHIRIVSWVELVAHVRVVRAVVCGRRAGRVHAFAVGILVDGSNASGMATVAVTKFIDAVVRDLLVLGCARLVAARLVENGHRIAADGFASAL
jgi:hypothetical protein